MAELFIELKDKDEAKEIMSYISEMSNEEKNSFLNFLQGVKFAKKIEKSKIDNIKNTF